MNPDRFQHMQDLFHAAREAGPEERTALLAGADPEMRREVESLLEQRPEGEFLNRAALENAPDLFDQTLTQPVSGLQLGPYRLEHKLGEGGMGQVFRALDTRLGRAVAIKTVHARFSDRFAREARAISSLNHPNICTLHDVGPSYLVMELLEGETLAAMLKRGPLPLQTALQYASQMLAALTEAHSKGIIHRDLKPGNIMIGKSGVKVLDFGLARSGQDETLTDSRMILGTPAYMAPEQRDGQPADHRSDIYAFGRVLFEMLTGQREGPLLSSIRPRKLAALVARCLERDPAQRWQSAAELQQQLATITPSRFPLRWAIAAAVLAALAAGAWLYGHRAPKLSARDTIVVAEFENKTSDPVFDNTLRQGLTVQLQQSPFLSLISDDRIKRVLQLMNRPAGTRLTPEVAEEICERTASSAVLDGSISGLGSSYIVWLRARNCQTGEVLAEEQTQTKTKEEVLDGLSRVAVQMRTRLGESLATVQQHSTPLAQATTSSLEALRSYTAGKLARTTQGGPAAIPHFRQAIAIDPKFAMAHAELGFIAWGMGQTDLGADEVRTAYSLRDRVSDWEQRYILMLYDRQVSGNLQKEMQTLESWAQTYPRDAVPLGIIGGWAAYGTGNYERGVQASEAAVRLDPDLPYPYAGSARHSISLDRYAQAEDVIKRAAARNIEAPELLVYRYYLAFLKGDQEGMKREIARAPTQRIEDWMLHNQALVLARAGRLRDALILWERAIALATQAGNRESAAIYQAAIAACEAHFGNASAAKDRARKALQLAKGRDVEYTAAYALARSGEMAESQRLAEALNSRFPEDTPVQFEYLGTLGALSALASKKPEDAIARLQQAVPYDLAMPGTAFFGMFGGLYTAYTRGEAYLAGGRGKEAAAEFQKVLDHRGVVLADPIGALAHLQLARASLLSGDRSKAQSEYHAFLDLWKDADSDLPVLREARAQFGE